MTPYEFLNEVKDHVTDTNKTLSESERTLLRSVTIQYRPPGSDAIMELSDIISGGVRWGETLGGKRIDGMPGNSGHGAKEIGPIVIWGFAHEHEDPCVLAFTVIHEMAHVIAEGRGGGHYADDGNGHNEVWALICRDLGIEERAYNDTGKNLALYRQCGWSLHAFLDKELLTWVHSLGPVTGWECEKSRRAFLA